MIQIYPSRNWKPILSVVTLPHSSSLINCWFNNCSKYFFVIMFSSFVWDSILLYIHYMYISFYCLITGIRQGRYTLQERTSTIMEVRKLNKEKNLTNDDQEHRSDLANDSQGHKTDMAVSCGTELLPCKDHHQRSLSDHSGSESGRSGSSYPCTSSSKSLNIHRHSSTESRSSEFPLENFQNGSLDPSRSSLGSWFGSSSSQTDTHHSIQHSSSAGVSQNSTDPSFPVITGNLSEQSVLLFIESLMTGYNEMKPFTKDMSDVEIHALLQDGFVSINSAINIQSRLSYVTLQRTSRTDS
jgi:hypothetical protein